MRESAKLVLTGFDSLIALVDKETLERLLIEERKSYRAVARETGFAISRLHYLAKQYGLQTGRSRLAKKEHHCRVCGTQEAKRFSGRHRSLCSHCMYETYLKPRRMQVVTPVVSDTLIR